MLKATLITLTGAGVIGTGAQTFSPQSVEITAGSIILEMAPTGFSVDVAANPDFAVTVKSRDERQLTVRL